MHLLFMCPHGAAKSVMATAIARDLAERRGMSIECANAGTDPDDVNHPAAVSELAQHGLRHEPLPRLVDRADIEAADVVIALGPVRDLLPVEPARYVDWSDVPNASEDAAALYVILRERVRGLMDGLPPS